MGGGRSQPILYENSMSANLNLIIKYCSGGQLSSIIHGNMQEDYIVKGPCVIINIVNFRGSDWS